MQIKEIPFTGSQIPKNVMNIAPQVGQQWSPPIKLPLPVRIDGKPCLYVNISEYGAIRLAEAKDGHYTYMSEDGNLPASITEFKDGYCIVPWGELQRLSGCGKSVRIYQRKKVVVIDFVTGSRYNKERYSYRVEFIDNKVRMYYYHCVSGYDTYVGMVLDPTDSIEWVLKENQPYMKKGLEITFDEQEEGSPAPAVIDELVSDKWSSIYKDKDVWVQVR